MPTKRLIDREAFPFLALIVAYTATGWLGLNAALEPGHATPVWPPSGVALAALLIGGVRLWPVIPVGALLLTWSAGPPPTLALIAIPIGNTAEALLAYYFLRRAGFSAKMESVRDVRLLLFWGAMIPPIASATIGSSTLVASGAIEPGLLPETWWTWWSGDALGILIVTPLILVWSGASTHERRYRPGELCLSVAAGAVASVIVVFVLPSTLYLTFIPVLWATGRMGLRGASTASAGIWLSVMTLTHVAGPGLVGESDALLQLFFAVLATTGLTLGAALLERDRARATVRERDDWSRTVLELSSDLVTVIGPDGRFTFVTPASERVLGYRPEEMVGRSSFEFVHPDDHARTQEALDRLQNSGSTFSLRVRVRHVSGEWRMLEALSKSALDNSSVRGIVVCSRDVTEQANVERTLNEARDAAIESARLRSDFLANVSHELRTPLNVVFGMTDMLLDTNLATTQREYAGAVRGSAKGLLRLIDDILDLAKIDAGRLEIVRRQIDFGVVVEEAVSALRPRAEDKGLKLDVSVDEDLRDTVWADPERIRQILLNYLSNAIKFTDSGSISVRAVVDRDTDDAVHARVDVTDSGIGIPSHRMNRLFKPFSQVDGSMTRTYGGTGLGLAISKQLAEMMGGEVSVTSTAGQGSTFSFTTRLAKQGQSIEKRAAAAGGR